MQFAIWFWSVFLDGARSRAKVAWEEAKTYALILAALAVVAVVWVVISLFQLLYCLLYLLRLFADTGMTFIIVVEDGPTAAMEFWTANRQALKDKGL